METKPNHEDWDLVLAAGGPVEVAKKLNLTGVHALQRVHNWRVRGVPALIKLQHPDVFPYMPEHARTEATS